MPSHPAYKVQYFFLYQYQIYHVHYLHFIWPLPTLLQLRNVCMHYLHIEKSITLLPLSFSPVTPNPPVMPAFILSPTHPFRSSNTHHLYPIPTLSTTLSNSYHNLSLSSPSPSVRPYTFTTHTLIPENVNLTHRALEFTHLKSVPLWHTSFIRWPHLP